LQNAVIGTSYSSGKDETAMDLLRALEVFIQTAETGSLSAAGRRLGMTSSAVSKQISALEDDVRAALLTRTTRGLSLTAVGRNCLTRARAIIGDVSAMRAALQDEGSSLLRGRLRLSMPPGFGRKRAWPTILRFAAAHPELEIDAGFSNEMVDLVANQIDVAIRIGLLTDSTLIATKLGTVRRLLVAAPAYLERSGPVCRPPDLSGHNCLQESHITSKSQWFFRGVSNDEFLTVGVKGTLVADDTQLLHQSVIDGEGIALLPDWWIEDDLLEDRLVVLLQDWVADIVVQPRGIYLVYPAMGYTPSKISVFVAFMKRELRPKASAPQ
jgi:DNA-binding transcriptional LysR family regulator